MTQVKMNTIPAPVPSVEEQKEIARVLDDLFGKQEQGTEAAERVIVQIDIMKKSNTRPCLPG